MHEYAVTKSMLDMVLAEAEKAHAAKVTEIRVAIGEMSTVVDESVQLYFEIMRQGTLAENAVLTFRRITARFLCSACNQEYDKPAQGSDCPACGSLGLPTKIGREFFLESMDIDNGTPPDSHEQ
jgi:hydrogenase nickel incorporation protein HypA/HybF